MEQYVDFSGGKHPYTRDWKDVDTEFRHNLDLGRQLKNTNYFKKVLPSTLFEESDDLKKAKAIYYYIQDQMAWNGKFRVSHEIDVKEAYERKSGNSSDINLSLLCALDAGGLDVKPMLISTRGFAMPVTQFPTINDFTTSIVLLEIGSEKYFLDVTDKNTPFGILPYRDLNFQGRVMDFKKGSYWEPILPSLKNMHYINAKIKANENGIFEGQVNEVSTGLISTEMRNKLSTISMERIRRSKETKSEIVEVTAYDVENKKDLEKPLKENYNIIVNTEDVGSKTLLFPFFVKPYFTENPFVVSTRAFPIDFGFPITNNYLISIDLADHYEVVEVPANKLLKLPMNDGELSVVFDVSGTKINIRLNVRLNNPQFAPEAYKSLQEYFDTLNVIQNDSPIVLKKF
ncbi:transglutaminase-like domain-containing protein [Ulvibacter antarcticus]|uniref:transglutaminase-like domain-containing protein n=1 Tax=Ulvibacter antarcticus TaxID=442714 RepID=UPI000EF9F5DB|nr:transglutaminase-like domain-containing protein [Ulvibacter antarcticus]